MSRKRENSNTHGGWALKRSGSSEAVGIYRTQKEAIAAAEKFAKKENSNFVIFERRSRPNTSLVLGDHGRAKTVDSPRVIKKNPTTARDVTRESIHIVPTGKGWEIRKATRSGTFVPKSKFASTEPSPEQKAADWSAWVDGHTGQKQKKPLPDKAISRESLYEDR